MKTITSLTKILIFFTIVLILCLVVDFLTLTDIYHDYVSKTVINRFAPQTIYAFPDWTNTSGEWSVSGISYFIRLVITVIILIFLIAISIKIIKVQQK